MFGSYVRIMVQILQFGPKSSYIILQVNPRIQLMGNQRMKKSFYKKKYARNITTKLDCQDFLV